MVYALTEEQKRLIEQRCGCYVIEFKMTFKRLGKTFTGAIEQINKVKEAACLAGKAIKDFIDDLRFIFEKIKHNICRYAQTSPRDKMVYVISKCSDIEKKCVWKTKRPAYLPRSMC